MVVIGVGLGMSFVPVTIAGTSGVAPEDSGLASGLLNTTQQVGGSPGPGIPPSIATSHPPQRRRGSPGLPIPPSIATSRTTSALHTGLALPAALTHGFKGAFIVGAV